MTCSVKFEISVAGFTERCCEGKPQGQREWKDENQEVRKGRISRDVRLLMTIGLTIRLAQGPVQALELIEQYSKTNEFPAFQKLLHRALQSFISCVYESRIPYILPTTSFVWFKIAWSSPYQLPARCSFCPSCWYLILNCQSGSDSFAETAAVKVATHVGNVRYSSGIVYCVCLRSLKILISSVWWISERLRALWTPCLANIWRMFDCLAHARVTGAAHIPAACWVSWSGFRARGQIEFWVLSKSRRQIGAVDSWSR